MDYELVLPISVKTELTNDENKEREVHTWKQIGLTLKAGSDNIKSLLKMEMVHIQSCDWTRWLNTGKARQGKFIYRAQFVHKAIQSALQLYKIRRRQIKSLKNIYIYIYKKKIKKIN